MHYVRQLFIFQRKSNLHCQTYKHGHGHVIRAAPLCDVRMCSNSPAEKVPAASQQSLQAQGGNCVPGPCGLRLREGV